MAYQLVDLAGHRSHYNPMEPRDKTGKWTLGGKHLSLSEERRFEHEHPDVVALADHVRELVTAAETAKPGTTQYEHAWADVADHLESLNSHAKKVASEARPGEKRQLKLKNAPAPVQKGAKHGYDVAEVGGTAAVATSLTTVGAHVAGAAGGLLGSEQASTFAEAFNHIAENPVAEAAIIVAVTLLLHALYSAIKKALQRHRDKRIGRARGLQPA